MAKGDEGLVLGRNRVEGNLTIPSLEMGPLRIEPASWTPFVYYPPIPFWG